MDKKFYREALEGLMDYKKRGFVVKFLEKIDLPVGSNLTEMQSDIENWLSEGDDSDCIKLLEYVDELRMWGRQHIFLFSLEDNDNIEPLYNHQYLKDKIGKVFENPVYEWHLDKPTLVHAYRSEDSSTNDTLLIFKFIEQRKFDRTVDDRIESSEERSTNFFIINLTKKIAELRLQKLPAGAHLNLKTEYELFITEIKKYFNKDIDRFKPISLDYALHTIIKRPIFNITRTVIVAKQGSDQSYSTILLIINRLFTRPIVSYVSGYWKCKQEILGRSKLYFSLYGNSNSMEIGGVADPKKIDKLIDKIVKIHTRKDARLIPRLNGLIEPLYSNLEGNSRAQAIVLSAGVVAALIIWIIIDSVSNKIYDGQMEDVLGEQQYFFLKILVEILWTIVYYGWNRTIRSFKALFNLSPRQFIKTIQEARKNKEAIKERIQAPLNSHFG